MRLKTSLGIAIGTALGTLVAVRSLRARRAVDFAGKTVVIFGGSRGLGLAMGREFSRAGAHVVLTARDEQELERAAADIAEQGGQVTTIACDISVITAVLRSATLNVGLFHSELKLCRPTQLPLSEPAVASVKLR